MSTPALQLSVLDLVPVRTGQSSAQAVAASLDLARTADALGYTRYWFAEHHNMPGGRLDDPAGADRGRRRAGPSGSGSGRAASCSPTTPRSWSAEQFAALEALAPGAHRPRHRAGAGGDPVITQLLRMAGTTSDVERFPDHVRDIASLVSDAGATVRFSSGGTYDVHATPAATTTPEGMAPRLQRLLGTAGCGPRSAVRVREPLLRPRVSSARSDIYRTHVPADRAALRLRRPSSRRTSSRRPLRRRRRPGALPQPADDGATAHEQTARRTRDRGAGTGRRCRSSTDSPTRSWPRARAGLVHRHRRVRGIRAPGLRRPLGGGRGDGLARRRVLRRRTRWTRRRGAACRRLESS